MKRKIKKYIFPGTALIASSYVSLMFTVGIGLGYMGTTFFDRKYMKTGRITPLKVDFGNWELHLHHWISGCLAIAIICFAGFPSTLPIFWIGALGGIVFHDIYTDKKWYKVLYKK